MPANLTILARALRGGEPTDVPPGTPSIGLSDGGALAFEASEVGDPPALLDTITITNVGTGTMSTPTIGSVTDADSILDSYSITGSGPWTLHVACNRGSLAVGVYNATIPIVATNADNTPQNVSVQLTISAAAGDVVDAPVYSLPLNESAQSIGWDTVNDKPNSDMFDFRTVPTVTGSTHSVSNTSQFTTALTNAVRGDVIEVADGTVLTGEFTLPSKSGSGFITIRSAGHASLPSVGSRVAAANAGNMFTIRSTSTGATTLKAAATAHSWRIIGAIITNESGSSNGSSLVDFTPESNSWSTKANACHDITFDRCWFKAQSAGQRRGWAPGGYNMAAYGCRFSGFNDSTNDSQAICTWEWVQRLHVENCYLDAATENIMFGGAPQWQLDGAWDDTWPVDIVIGRCEFAKSGSPATQTWKNMFEVKNAARGVLWGCVFHGARTDAQNQVIIIEANNQGDVAALASYTRAENWTVRGNVFYDCDGDILRVAEDNGTLVTAGMGCNRVEFSYNLAYGWLVSGADTGGGDFQPAGNEIVPDVTYRNNTIVDTGPHSYVYYDDTNVGTYSTFGHSIYNNIFAHTTFFGWFFNVSGGTSATKCDIIFGSGNWRVDHNLSIDSCAVTGGTPNNTGTNSTVANLAAFKFTNTATDDYSLASDSPAKGAGSDGRDLGCSWATLQSNISGVETG